MRDYMAKLRKRGAVIIIESPVDPKFELAAVTQRLKEKSDRIIRFRTRYWSNSLASHCLPPC